MKSNLYLSKEQKLLLKNIDPFEDKVPVWAIIAILVGTLLLLAPAIFTFIGIIYGE